MDNGLIEQVYMVNMSTARTHLALQQVCSKRVNSEVDLHGYKSLNYIVCDIDQYTCTPLFFSEKVKYSPLGLLLTKNRKELYPLSFYINSNTIMFFL